LAASESSSEAIDRWYAVSRRDRSSRLDSSDCRSDATDEMTDAADERYPETLFLKFDMTDDENVPAAIEASSQR